MIIASSNKASAEKTIAVELAPPTSTQGLADLEAPSTEDSGKSNRAVKEIQRIRQDGVSVIFA